MSSFVIFETGCGKYVRIEEDKVLFDSNINRATMFHTTLIDVVETFDKSLKWLFEKDTLVIETV